MREDTTKKNETSKLSVSLVEGMFACPECKASSGKARNIRHRKECRSHTTVATCGKAPKTFRCAECGARFRVQGREMVFGPQHRKWKVDDADKDNRTKPCSLYRLSQG